MNNHVKLLWIVPVNTRLRRRGLVVAFYASLALGCSLAWFIHLATSDPAVLYAGMVASFFLLWACYSALVDVLREYGFVGSHVLHSGRDERQEQVRHAAYVRAYWILMFLVCVASAVFLSGMAARISHLTWSFVGKPLVPVAAIVLAVSLPSAVIAWTEPDLKEAA